MDVTPWRTMTTSHQMGKMPWTTSNRCDVQLWPPPIPQAQLLTVPMGTTPHDPLALTSKLWVRCPTVAPSNPTMMSHDHSHPMACRVTPWPSCSAGVTPNCGPLHPPGMMLRDPSHPMAHHVTPQPSYLAGATPWTTTCDPWPY